MVPLLSNVPVSDLFISGFRKTEEITQQAQPVPFMTPPCDVRVWIEGLHTRLIEGSGGGAPG